MEPSPTPTVRSADWRTLPNLISAARLVATPLLFWLIVKGHTNWATALLGLMGVSDYVDGYLARSQGTVSDLGVLLDPLSDRILVMATIVALLQAGILPLWLGVPVLLRDAALSVVFLALSRRGFGRPKVKRLGKSATFALLTALPAMLLGESFSPMRTLGLVLFIIGAVFYYIVGYRYAKDVQAFLTAGRAPFAGT